jgi:16S rRNA processing protein RimM
VTLLEVGRILRAHGLRGEVVVDLLSDRPGRLAPGAVLDSDGGPLTVVTSRAFGDKHLVHFAGMVDRNGADALRGRLLRAEAADDDGGEELWVHRLIGATVLEVDGTCRGEIVSVEANPAADLLVLASGALVPVNFVVEVVDSRIVVDVPPGLFE